MPMDIAIGRHIPGMPWWPPLVSSAVGVALCALLLSRRRSPTVRLGTWAFAVNMAVILASLWITNGHYARDPDWVPFQAHKLGILATPLLAPTLRVGLVGIAAIVGSAIAQYHLLLRQWGDRLPAGETWVLLIYGTFGLVLLANRVREVALERSMLRARSEAATSARLASVALALRDYANSPLQTLELGVEIIRGRHPDIDPVVERMKHALRRLEDLNEILNRHLPDQPRPGSVSESFDSATLLQPTTPRRAT